MLILLAISRILAHARVKATATSGAQTGHGKGTFEGGKGEGHDTAVTHSTVTAVQSSSYTRKTM